MANQWWYDNIPAIVVSTLAGKRGYDSDMGSYTFRLTLPDNT